MYVPRIVSGTKEEPNEVEEDQRYSILAQSKSTVHVLLTVYHPCT